MQSAGDEEGREEGSSRNERDTNLQDEGDKAEEGATEPSAPEGDSQDQSAPQSDDTVPQPHPDLIIVDEYNPAARNSVQENEAHLLNLNTSEAMEDQQPPPEDEEEEDEFIVLDPEHPLVRRQQAALSIQLNKQLERINLELKEKLAVEKAVTSHMQEVGVEMFTVQEQLARLQNKLEDGHQTKAQAEAKHRQTQDQLETIKSQYSCTISQDREAEASVSRLQTELDNVMQHLLFTQGVSEDLHSKVKIMNNARRKAGAEKTQAEEQKMKQDLYVERLTKDMERLKQQIEMYEAQTSAQAEETLATKEALSEAEMEMESLLVTRKQLLQQWNSSLTGMRRRDEAFSAMQDAMCEIEHQVILLDREIEGYKKSITAEQDQNETLTIQLNWSQMDCTTSKKLISQKQAQQEALQAHYSTCIRTLRQTEQTLTTLKKEASAQQTELNDQRRQLEKESSVRLDLEKKIVTNMQQKLTHNKAAKYSQRLTSKMASHKKEKMCQLQQLENEILTVRLQNQQVDQHVNSLAVTQQALDEEIANYNKLLTLNQNNVSSFVTLINQKQTAIATCKTNICQITSSTGHDDLSPLQIKIQAVMGQIEDLAVNIKSDQQLWMRQQETLVGLTQEIESNSRQMLKLQTDYTAMHQKKIRLQSQIESEHREEKELEKNLKTLKRDLVKLNTLLSKNGQLSHALEQENALTEMDFVHRLKEAERGCIEVQMKHEKTHEEKERLLNSLLEAERQIMLWEKKIQLVKETRSVVDTEVRQGEIQVMKAEIHRMEVRLNQLMKQRERLLRESEATVARRETIVLRREAMVHNSHKQTTKGDLSRLIQGLQRKTQETHKHAEECEQVIRELSQSQVSLSDNLKKQKQQLIELCGNGYMLDSDFENLQDTKDRKLAHLVALQSRTKRLQGVCKGSYKAFSSSESVGEALQGQMERMHAASAILHRICEEFPQHQGALRKTLKTLAELTQQEQKGTWESG
ncbi:coiled-coil domain-containing protein 40 isoform X2 [Acanthochromis polyacanthus]|nr:coiled-coil domain-containing protein 40 isoform X2 [Acanthochromis polyacanthus]